MDEWDGIVQSVIVVGGGISQNIFETLSLREPVKIGLKIPHLGRIPH